MADEVYELADLPEAAQDLRDAAILRESIQEFPGPVAVYDSDDRLIACNATYRWVHGGAFERVQCRAGKERLRYDDLVRESSKSVVPPERLEAHVADRLRAQREASGEPVDRYYPDRGWFRIVKIRTPSGAVVGFATDITELKETTLALEQARAEAESASRAKSAFLANMSHELRTPLNAIIGMAEALECGIFGVLEDERHRRYVSDIRRSGHHLLALISDLLDLAKVEAGALEMEVSRFELAELLEDCAAMMRPIAERQAVHLDLQEVPPALCLSADRRKLKQVLLNLLTNAANYSHPGGRVRLRVTAGREGMELVVEDEGIGFDETQIERAFQPFGRLDHRLARHPEGTGLGLPIARRFIELHGGHIAIASRAGEGTRVTVWLPPDIVG